LSEAEKEARESTGAAAAADALREDAVGALARAVGVAGGDVPRVGHIDPCSVARGAAAAADEKLTPLFSVETLPAMLNPPEPPPPPMLCAKRPWETSLPS